MKLRQASTLLILQHLRHKLLASRFTVIVCFYLLEEKEAPLIFSSYRHTFSRPPSSTRSTSSVEPHFFLHFTTLMTRLLHTLRQLAGQSTCRFSSPRLGTHIILLSLMRSTISHAHGGFDTSPPEADGRGEVASESVSIDDSSMHAR